jgi:uncharacterized protein
VVLPLYRQRKAGIEDFQESQREAVKWFRLSAEQGNVGAVVRLGHAYSKGWGVPQSSSESRKWGRLAAEMGDPFSQSLQGNNYFHGKDGYIKDIVQAYKWMNLSAANGYEFAKGTRDLYEQMMTPEQIAEAQKLSRKWIEDHK